MEKKHSKIFYQEKLQREEEWMEKEMEKENEDLLAVFPDFKDEDVLRMFSEQEHASDLEKMDLDIGSDFSQIFSEVLTHEPKGLFQLFILFDC